MNIELLWLVRKLQFFFLFAQSSFWTHCRSKSDGWCDLTLGLVVQLVCLEVFLGSLSTLCRLVFIVLLSHGLIIPLWCSPGWLAMFPWTLNCLIFATVVTGTSSYLERISSPFAFDIMAYNFLSHFLRQLSHLLFLVHISCGTYDDIKQQSVYFSPLL